MNPWGLAMLAAGLIALAATLFNWIRRSGGGRTWLRLVLAGAGVAVATAGAFLTGDLLAVGLVLVVFSVLALQWWVALTSKGDLYDPNVIKFPPDGCA